MALRFGDHDTTSTVKIDDGMYEATISMASLVTENGKPKLNTNNKNQLDVFFKLDEDTTIKRRYSIGFGQNTSNAQWSAFAKMLEAATGVRCGDPGQKDLTDAQLIGKAVRIVVVTNERGYPDVSNVMAAPKAAAAAQRQKPQPIAQQQNEREEEALAEIPF